MPRLSQPMYSTPLGNIPSEMLDSVAKEVITTPEDKAEFDELVTRLSVSSGIPEEEAQKYALSTIAERKKAERAQQAREAGVAEEAEVAAEAAPVSRACCCASRRTCCGTCASRGTHCPCCGTRCCASRPNPLLRQS